METMFIMSPDYPIFLDTFGMSVQKIPTLLYFYTCRRLFKTKIAFTPEHSCTFAHDRVMNARTARRRRGYAAPAHTRVPTHKMNASL